MYARTGRVVVPEQNMAARVNCTILTEEKLSFPLTFHWRRDV